MTDQIHDSNSSRPTSESSGNISQAIREFIHQDNASPDNKKVTRLHTSGRQFFAREEVIAALSKLQLSYKSAYVPGQQVNINTEAFKKALLNTMAMNGNTNLTKSVNQIDGRTIDFVEMIFGAFLRDKNISNSIKTLLLKLQIPVIKISLLDNQFFHNNKHPARNMMDAIAHLGIGIEDTDNTLYKTIDMIVDQLLKTFDHNIACVNTALKALERLGSNEKVSQEKTEKETRKIILKEHARQIILAELQFNIKGKTIPKMNQQLVLRNWSTLMYQRYIKHGNQSKEWTEAIDILRLLINTLQSPKSHNEYLSLKDNHMSLVQTINELLNTSSQSKELIHNAIHSLKASYQNILENSEFKSSPNNSIPQKSRSLNTEYCTDEPSTNSPMDQKIAEAQTKINQLPESVKPGVWFEIYTSENHPVRRLKLSVIVQEDAKLVFVDRLGVKILEKDADDFATELDVGQSHILADHSIFDHALTNVISSLAAAR
ncbi:MAG: DUF1631 domain-containing protein [Gammaproteobacteria bacterium]|nr:DUF1631 domain-containing protein [Gammaproteobacteria bacterium]